MHTEESKEKMRKIAIEQKRIPPSRLGKTNFGRWKGHQIVENKNEYFRLYMSARRAKIRQVAGSFTIGEWENLKKQYGFICPCCHKSEPEISLTIDHIIPISRGGCNSIENIQPLCRSCNSRKYTKIIKFDLIG